MAIAEKKLTWDDIKDWPVDAGRKTELVDGRVVVSPSAGRSHSLANTRLGYALSAFVLERDLGELHVAPIDCVLDEHTVYQPDLCFVRKERARQFDDKVDGAPDLAIEILSPSNRKHDTDTKFQGYAAFGVQEYWLVDPAQLVIRTYENLDGRFELLSEARRENAVVTRVLEGLELKAIDVFPEN